MREFCLNSRTFLNLGANANYKICVACAKYAPPADYPGGARVAKFYGAPKFIDAVRLRIAIASLKRSEPHDFAVRALLTAARKFNAMRRI